MFDLLDGVVRYTRHESADVLLSLPGFGAVLAATFLANIGGNLDGFDTGPKAVSGRPCF